jgi:AP-4 complex subunit beta-1
MSPTHRLSNSKYPFFLLTKKLMTSVIKIFMRKPAEMHPGLCKLLRCILLNENEDIDVLDRAGFYYNTMKNNIQDLQTTLAEVRVTETQMCKAEKKRVAEYEWNTLSIIYEKAGETFTKPLEYFMLQRNKETALEEDDPEELVEGPVEKVTQDDIDGLRTPPAPAPTQTAPNPQETILDDILGMDSHPQSGTPNAPHSTIDSMYDYFELEDDDEFREFWEQNDNPW